MRKHYSRSSVALGMLLAFALSPSVSATTSLERGDGVVSARADDSDSADAQRRRRRHHRRGSTNAHGAPEINASLLGGGIALLIGGTLVLLGQRRTRHQPRSTWSG